MGSLLMGTTTINVKGLTSRFGMVLGVTQILWPSQKPLGPDIFKAFHLRKITVFLTLQPLIHKRFRRNQRTETFP